MKNVAVFVDLDETIYPGLTIKDTARWMLAHGYLSKWAYLKILWWLFLRSIGRLNHEAAFRGGAELLKGYRNDELQVAIREAYERFLKPKLSGELRQHIRTWKRRGRLVLATESLGPIARAFAEDLGFDDVLATELEIKSGVVTGRLAGSPLFGNEKVRAIEAWANEHDVRLEKSLAIGGKLDDLPMFESVGGVIIYEGDEATIQFAHKKGWHVTPPGA